MSEVTKQDIEILSSKDDETLAEWHCMMNRWEWPSSIPNEPNDKDLPSSEWGKNRRRGDLMDFIQARVGHRLISWTWNKKRMSLEEFNDFYAGTYLADEEAKARSDERILKSLNLTRSDFD